MYDAIIIGAGMSGLAAESVWRITINGFASSNAIRSLAA